MPSPFEILNQAMSRTIDTVHAAAFTFEPMATPANGRPSADPGRQVLTIKGVLFTPEDMAEFSNRDTASNWLSSEISSRMVELGVTLEQFDGEMPQAGDLVTHIESRDKYVVRLAEPDGGARVILKMNGLG